jgi:hypothetical protein
MCISLAGGADRFAALKCYEHLAIVILLCVDLPVKFIYGAWDDQFYPDGVGAWMA